MTYSLRRPRKSFLKNVKRKMLCRALRDYYYFFMCKPLFHLMHISVEQLKMPSKIRLTFKEKCF